MSCFMLSLAPIYPILYLDWIGCYLSFILVQHDSRAQSSNAPSVDCWLSTLKEERYVESADLIGKLKQSQHPSIRQRKHIGRIAMASEARCAGWSRYRLNKHVSSMHLVIKRISLVENRGNGLYKSYIVLLIQQHTSLCTKQAKTKRTRSNGLQQSTCGWPGDS